MLKPVMRLRCNVFGTRATIKYRPYSFQVGKDWMGTSGLWKTSANIMIVLSQPAGIYVAEMYLAIVSVRSEHCGSRQSLFVPCCCKWED